MATWTHGVRGSSNFHWHSTTLTTISEEGGVMANTDMLRELMGIGAAILAQLKARTDLRDWVHFRIA